MRTVILLVISNIFMTFAWYYHLKQERMAIVEGDFTKLAYRFF